MDAVPYVQVCKQVDLDVSTGVCAHPYWVPQQVSVFQPLTAAEGGVIGASILAAWAVGFGIRCMRRVL